MVDATRLTPRRGVLARPASAIALVSAAGAVLALAAELFLESRRTSLTCGNQTLVLDRLLIASLASSVLAVTAGIVAIASRPRHAGSAILAVLTAGTVVALMLVFDGLGGYLCQTSAP